LSKILDIKQLAPEIKRIIVSAPAIAQKAEPGQFVIVRVYEGGERIPLTISDFDRAAGTISLVVQEVGKTTRLLGSLEAGDNIKDVLGPLGCPAAIEKVGTVVCVAGGVGTAIIYPEARKHKQAGNTVITLVGARTHDLLFYKDELSQVSDELRFATDDGSYGHHGFVTDLLADMLEQRHIDEVIAIGPLPMMKAVSDLTKQYGVKTVVSLNPIMIDGTGMCGGCRVSVGGTTKFACVDGPEFDAHLVDFDELIARTQQYRREERLSAGMLEAGGCKGDCHGQLGS